VNVDGDAPHATPVATLGGHPLSTHDHVCVFFHGGEERDRLVLPFLSDGLAAGHAVLFLASAGETAHLRAQLGDRGDLELAEPDAGHLRNGRYAPAELLEGLERWAVRKRVADGRVFGRLAGDMSWIARLQTPQLIETLVAEEVSVTGLVQSYPQVCLCLYDLDLFGGDLIIPMIKAHPKAWIEGTLIENPYHLLT
jgi:hypothetical protein